MFHQVRPDAMAAVRLAPSGAPVAWLTGLLTRAQSPPFRLHEPESYILHALDFLRCASATAYELGDELIGSKRDLAFAAMHMAEMAKVMVERSLECVEEV
ncbi:DUF6124 family protein [Pseudomonas viridiflava]|uniref:DUF6124 family protein n=1 Tax=Pseudomonas syringae group TaxID=136849 RepID=UPI0039B8E6B0